MKIVITLSLLVFTISTAVPEDYLSGKNVYSAMNLINEGKYSEAVTLLESSPVSPERDLSLGIACLHLERYDDAEKWLKGVVEALPESLSARYSLAMLYETRKDFKKAIKQWNKVLSLADTDTLRALALKHIKILESTKE